MTGLLISGGLLAALLLASKNKKSDLPIDDNWAMDDGIAPPPASVEDPYKGGTPSPPTTSTSSARPSSEPRPWRGTYSRSVKVDMSKVGAFNVKSFRDNLIKYANAGNIFKIGELLKTLNVSRVRLLHNEFLNATKGTVSLSDYVNSKLPYAARLIANPILINAGVGKTVKKEL